MKKIILTFIIISLSIGLFAQKKHIRQSTPFENVLLAMQTDSAQLYRNTFSFEIINGETDTKVWKERVSEGKEKFWERFGQYKLSDFKYGFDKKESKLIIYFKEEEQFRIKIIKEKKKWKLNEK